VPGRQSSDRAGETSETGAWNSEPVLPERKYSVARVPFESRTSWIAGRPRTGPRRRRRQFDHWGGRRAVYQLARVTDDAEDDRQRTDLDDGRTLVVRLAGHVAWAFVSPALRRGSRATASSRTVRRDAPVEDAGVRSRGLFGVRLGRLGPAVRGGLPSDVEERPSRPLLASIDGSYRVPFVHFSTLTSGPRHFGATQAFRFTVARRCAAPRLDVVSPNAPRSSRNGRVRGPLRSSAAS